MSPSDGIKMSKPLLGRRWQGPKRLDPEDHRKAQLVYLRYLPVRTQQFSKPMQSHLRSPWNSPIQWQDASSLCNFKLFKSAISSAFLGRHKVRDSSMMISRSLWTTRYRERVLVWILQILDHLEIIGGNCYAKWAKVNGNIEDDLRLSKAWHLESLPSQPILAHVTINPLTNFQWTRRVDKSQTSSSPISAQHLQPCNHPPESVPDSRSMVSKWLPTLVTSSNFPISLTLHPGHPDQTFQGFMTIGI